MRNRLSSAAKWWALLCFSAFFGAQLHAQQLRVRKGDCLPQGLPGDTHHAQGPHRLPAINRQWDSERTYRQLVILVSYSDTDFQSDDPQARYNDMLNTPGYNERQGAGCLAEYFKVQSAGRFNVAFDVYGPYKVSTKAQPYANPTVNTHNYAVGPMTEATQLFLNDEQGGATLDFSPYDWNGDKRIEQVLYVMAGPTGNVSLYGYVWPNTSSFAAITTPDGHIIANYSNSAEYWPLTNSSPSCGIGTIAHEYSHSLGLPDIYPTSSSVTDYSIVDEWDLMDGGNFTNYGWCPPNYTALEKMLLGWFTPTELNDPATITGMKPLSEGGQAYLVRHTQNEYLLLENRRWEGWDYCSPGEGLVVYHVNYDATAWAANRVNIVNGKPYFSLVAADGMTYTQWETLLLNSGKSSKYAEKERIHNLLLSTAPYPLVADGQVVNDELTNTSVPPSKMYTMNDSGKYDLSKPITNIVMNDDGTIDFDFLGGVSTDIVSRLSAPPHATTAVYDLYGRKTPSTRQHGLLIVRRPDGTVRKVVR